MQFEGSVIKEQGITFGIVIVKPSVLRSDSSSEEMMGFGVRAFGSMPIVLAAQEHGRFRYRGRQDIVKFLSNVHPSQIPWKKYTI
jgi:hypothetical protein